jgi:hypothetical protein
MDVCSESPTEYINTVELHLCDSWSSSSSLSSSSSSICHAVWPRVDPFRSHVSRSLFKGLPRFLQPVTQQCFITLGNLLQGILFTCCILYMSEKMRIFTYFTGQQNLTFFLTHGGKYLFLIQLLTLNSNM